jgi:spoIIIJ-associated protein
MKQIETKAKTVHEAIEDAVAKLGVTQDQVSIEILSQGGMFGKARVLVTVSKKETGCVLGGCEEASPATRTARVPASKQSEAGKRVPQSQEANEKTPSTKPVSGGTSCVKFDKTLAFVTEFLRLLGNDATVTTELTEKSFDININGEHIGNLIGKNGTTLNAIQAIVTSIAISNSAGEGKRVLVNVGDYKERRGDTLHSIAMKKAEYVKRTGRFCKLDPMNARDRAIIHTHLQEVEGIKTYSTGKDPFRCLCIAPADEK